MGPTRNQFTNAARSGMDAGVRPLLILTALASACLLQAPEALAAHTRATILLASDTAQPGETVQAGVRLQTDPGWHTYWQNPGMSGIATTVNWDLPPGVTAGPLQWPVPEKTTDAGLTTYIYPGDVVLPVTLTLASNTAAGPLQLKAHVAWLECNLSCVPGKGDATATLMVGADQKPSADAALLAAWRKKLPVPGVGIAARAWWEKPATGDVRPLAIEWQPATHGSAADADFFAYANDNWELEAPVTVTPGDAGAVLIRKNVKKLSGDWPGQVAGVLVEQPGDNPVAYDVSLPIAPGPQAAAPAVASGPSRSATSAQALAAPLSLWKALYIAFLGGLILNLMPCVLPVISLKILSFVKEADSDARRIRRLGLSYCVGVLAFFLAQAGVVIAVKAAGGAASWGIFFQSPEFVVVLSILVTLVALNLFGLFEANLGGRVMGAAGELAAKEGVTGAFLNGVLATVLATPCTAAFLAPALGYAFTRSPSTIVLIFLMVGIGLAAPYLVLSWNPAWLKLLPKPGVWMERFRVAMGFPMLATAVWLVWVAAPSFGDEGALWLGLFLVLTGVSAWIWGQFVQQGRSRRGLAMGLSAAILILAYFGLLEDQLHWRAPVASATTSAAGVSAADGIDWKPWSPQAVLAARAAGRPILVDFTARWCLTCQVNKKTSIEIPSVRAKLKAINAVALIEDSPAKDATVVAELNRYGRAGVPLVLVYPRDPSMPPQVLPELLTPGIVLAALDKAASESASSAANP